MKKLQAILITMSFSVIAFTQQTNFTGTWMLEIERPIDGPIFSNAIPAKIKVDQKKDSLIIEIASTENGKETISRQTFAMDGKESIGTTVNKRKYVRSLAWSPNKKSLTIKTVYYRPEDENELDFTRIETWSLSKRQLNINKKSIETRNESWEVNGVYEKQ